MAKWAIVNGDSGQLTDIVDEAVSYTHLTLPTKA